MDMNRYLSDCRKMAQLKEEDENMRKVYADVDFYVLIREVMEHLEHLKTAEDLFNVSQREAAAPIGIPGEKE